MPETFDKLSSAQVLGQYRRELLSEGIDDEIVNQIVYDLAFQMHRDGGSVTLNRAAVAA